VDGLAVIFDCVSVPMAFGRVDALMLTFPEASTFALTLRRWTDQTSILQRRASRTHKWITLPTTTCSMNVKNRTAKTVPVVSCDALSGALSVI